MPEGKGYPKCFDPYLLYAISTYFEYFSFFDETNFKLFLLVELKKAGQADEFAEKMNRALSERSVDLGPTDDNTPYATMRTGTMAVTAAVPGSPVFDLWEEYVCRVELSLPLKMSVEEFNSAKEKKLEKRWKEGGESAHSNSSRHAGRWLPFCGRPFSRDLGDGAVTHGCWASGTRTGVRRRSSSRSRPPVCLFGLKLSDFKYGLEFRRHFPAFLKMTLPGGGKWVSTNGSDCIRRRTGSLDEDGCYAEPDLRASRAGSRTERM